MTGEKKRLKAFFYKTKLGSEPVRDFIVGLSLDDRKIVGLDIAVVEFGWPVGMPTCRPMGNGLFEVRSKISSGRISRILFFNQPNRMVLLHAFIKKTEKTPNDDLNLALARKKDVEK